MADNVERRNLELERILATLASLPAAAEPQQSQNRQGEVPIHQPHTGPQNDQRIYAPQQQQPQQRTLDPRLVGRSAPRHFHSTPTPQERSSKPLVDASTITEWKHGLRCVNKIIAQNVDFGVAIRKLMNDQEQNVKQWEAGRARLIEDQKHKRENEQTHRAALSLPGLLDGTAMLRTPEYEKKELDQYLMKVYRASTAMVESQTSSLKALGVPFFGVQPHLVLVSGKEATRPTESNPDVPNGKITKEELLELQRKMLNYLTDLYGE